MVIGVLCNQKCVFKVNMDRFRLDRLLITYIMENVKFMFVLSGVIPTYSSFNKLNGNFKLRISKRKFFVHFEYLTTHINDA